MKNWSIAIGILIVVGIVFTMTLVKNDWDLGNNYYYLPPYEAVDIGNPEGSMIYKSYQREVFSEIKIYGEVTVVNHDENFIIAIQRKSDKAENTNNKILSYFIINKKTDAIYGPLSERNYIQKRKELGVPKALEFPK